MMQFFNFSVGALASFAAASFQAILFSNELMRTGLTAATFGVCLSTGILLSVLAIREYRILKQENASKGDMAAGA